MDLISGDHFSNNLEPRGGEKAYDLQTPLPTVNINKIIAVLQKDWPGGSWMYVKKVEASG